MNYPTSIVDFFNKYGLSISKKEPAIYAIKNKKNNKYYIGQSVHVSKRIVKHFLYAKRDAKTMAISRAILKYGFDNFEIDILEFFSSKESQEYINKMECFYIDIYESMVSFGGYNIRSGGSNGSLSKETRDKLSKINTGKKFTEERINKYKMLFSGKNNPRYGVKMTQETKDKIAQKSIGRICSQETRERMSLSRKGKKKSEEHKKNIGKAHLGLKQSDKTKSLISAANKKKVINLDTGDIYDGAVDAAIAMNVSKDSMYKTLSGLYLTCKGYRWAYLK